MVQKNGMLAGPNGNRFSFRWSGAVFNWAYDRRRAD